MYARPLNLTGNRITYTASLFRPRARIIHQLEIPQRTSLLPYQGVLSFGWKHARRRHPAGLGASRDDATSSQRLPARRSLGRSLRARSSKACNSKAATPRKFFSYGGALTRGGRSDQRLRAWRRDPDQNEKQHDRQAQRPPHHQLADASAFLWQIVNEAQHQLAGFLVARQIVNVLRSHGLPPDYLQGNAKPRGNVPRQFIPRKPLLTVSITV